MGLIDGPFLGTFPRPDPDLLEDSGLRLLNVPFSLFLFLSLAWRYFLHVDRISKTKTQTHLSLYLCWLGVVLHLLKHVIVFGKARAQGESSVHWVLLKAGFFGFLAVSIEHVILLFAGQVLSSVLNILTTSFPGPFPWCPWLLS